MHAASSFQMQDIICIAPALLLFISSLLPITLKVLNKNTEPAPFSVLTLALIGVIGSVTISSLLFAQLKTAYYAFSSALVFDGTSAFSAILVSLLAGGAAVLAYENKATKGEHFSEFIFLLLNAAVGMLILSWANDLIVVFIGIEMMSLCLYLLIALSHEGKLSKEAAFKYFVLGSFASAIFLYGLAFVYGMSGTTYINTLAQISPTLMAQNGLFVIGIILMIVGFCFKAAIAPFHAWTPDVYQGSPTPVTAFMATGVKLVTFVAFLRFIRGDYLINNTTASLLTTLQWIAVLTMIVGNTAAIVQNNLKRMLAYSSIAHSGYVLIGIIVAAIGGESWRGDFSVLYYLFSYAVMTFGAFAIVSILERKEDDIILVSNLKGLSKRHPLMALMFTIFMLSLAGIPPLVGFFGKFFIFSAAIKQGLFWLAFWGAINSVISAYYYLRPIVYMYMTDEEGAVMSAHHRLSGILISFSAILVVALGIATEPVYNYIKHVISSF